MQTCGLAWCLCIPVGGSGQFVQVEAEVVGGPANGSEGVDALESMSVLVPLPLSSFIEFYITCEIHLKPLSPFTSIISPFKSFFFSFIAQI